MHPPPPEQYYLAFSGGKDSQAIYHLTELAGVEFDAHYRITSVDPPELVQFIKRNYKTREKHPVSMETPHDKDGKPITMWSLIASHTMPPTRVVRYCCEKLKESGGKGRVTITGVRWAESPKRKNTHGAVDIRTQSKKIINDALENVEGAKLSGRGGLILNDDNDEARRMVENCFRTRKIIVNPIIDWEEEDVWYFLNEVVQVEHCKLYDPPYNRKRLGCIGCPLAGGKKMRKDFEEYPKYKAAYIRAFQKMIDNHPGEIRVLELDDDDIKTDIIPFTASENDAVGGKPQTCNGMAQLVDEVNQVTQRQSTTISSSTVSQDTQSTMLGSKIADSDTHGGGWAKAVRLLDWWTSCY